MISRPIEVGARIALPSRRFPMAGEDEPRNGEAKVEHCALCGEVSRESLISFHHVRQQERVSMELALCEGCATRLEKHLKRAIPKRLMEFDRVQAVGLSLEHVGSSHPIAGGSTSGGEERPTFRPAVTAPSRCRDRGRVRRRRANRARETDCVAPGARAY